MPGKKAPPAPPPAPPAPPKSFAGSVPGISKSPITDENILIDDNSPDWTCIYCGRQWPAAEPVAVLQAHVLECELHPAAKFIKIVRKAARMGLCSQTHHEHLMVEAHKALVEL